MKRNKLFIIGALLLAQGCSEKSPKTLLSKWNSLSEDQAILTRKLASSKEAQCLKDVYSVETLRAEVKELERNFQNAEKVKGSWKHLDLSKLPVPQANFLKTYGEKIGDLRNPESIDYSSCSSVPCIYNKIYGSEEGVAGYVHYLWYLRVGNMLSADNMSPTQASKFAGEYNGKVHPLSSYLYNDKELYGLWRLTLMLKTPHTTLSYLKEVQRIPRGERFEGKDLAGACGLAYSQGWILLNDGCLTISYDQDMGYLYQAVTHELSHHVDFQEGRGSRDFYRSHKKDYLNLAGMYILEYVNEKGENVRQWKRTEESKIITGYAGTSPQENFAESLAVFRVDGDKAKKNITDEHYQFVSRDYYQNRAFHKEALISGWIKAYSAETEKEIFKAVIDCSKGESSEKSSYFRASDFNSPIMPGMLNCLGSSATSISQNLRSKTILKEPEGCLSSKDSSTQGIWDSEMKKFLTQGVDRYLGELKKDAEYLARIQKFYDQIADKTIAREAFLQCYGTTGEEICFNSKIKNLAMDKVMELMLPENQTIEMANMYVSYHSYDKTRDDVLMNYKNMVSAHEDGLRELAQHTWESCQGMNHNDDETPTGSLFMISNGYMVSSFYNCLNLNLPETIKDGVRSITVDGTQVQHAKEEVILSDVIKPIMVKFMQDWYSVEKTLEKKKADIFITQDGGKIRQSILSNFNWVKNVVDGEAILSDCKKEAYKLLPMMPLYHQKSELFSDYVSKNSCYNVQNSKEFNDWLDSSKDAFNEKVSEGLLDKLTDEGNKRALKCIESFPMDTTLNKLRFRRQREACLLDEWGNIEQRVIKSSLEDPVVKKFQISEASLREKLEVNRRRIQLRVIKEHFN